MLYSKNLNVAKTAAKLIAENHITRFHTQNALYVFMEDIKNPFLTNYRKRHNITKRPAYTGYQNYDPIINYLIEKNVLTRSRGSYRVSYSVNKENLSNFLQTI
jgi:hypothetical protein